MGHKVRPSKLFHEFDIMAAAFAAAAERIYMLFGVIYGQMDKTVLVGKFERFQCLFQAYAPGGTLLHLLVCHVVDIKTDLQGIIAPFVLFSAEALGQCKRA